MASQISEREDSVLCSDLRDKLFGPMEFTLRDLVALNIMRGRDNGLPDYNSARIANGLPPKNYCMDINPELIEEQPELLSLRTLLNWICQHTRNMLCTANRQRAERKQHNAIVIRVAKDLKNASSLKHCILCFQVFSWSALEKCFTIELKINGDT